MSTKKESSCPQNYMDIFQRTATNMRATAKRQGRQSRRAAKRRTKIKGRIRAFGLGKKILW